MHFLSPIETFKRNPLTHQSKRRGFLRPSNSCSWILTSRILMSFPLVLLSVHVKRSAIGNEPCTSCILCLQDVYLDDFKCWSIFWGLQNWLVILLNLALHPRYFWRWCYLFPRWDILIPWTVFSLKYLILIIPFEVIGISDPCCFICWKLLLCKRTSSLPTLKYQVYDLRSLTARPWKIMVGIQSFPIGMLTVPWLS